MTEALVPLLSDEQIAVRDCEDPFVVVLASAGSGKTEVVAQRVERVLNSSSGFRVLALSYTRRAATELRERFEARIESHTRVDTDTIHGFAQGLLLQYGTWIGLPPEPVVVTDDADRIELLQSWRRAGGLPDLDEPKEALERIDLKRAQAKDDEEAEDWAHALAESGAMDYEAMLTLAHSLLQLSAVARSVSKLYRHVIVDEAQNLTASQYRLIERLAEIGEGSASCMLVGDDKQSIVGFAGASPRYMKSFGRKFGATVFRLTKNFRSAASIAALVERVAAELGDPASVPQDYAASGRVRRVNFADERSEAHGVSSWVTDLLTNGLSPASIAPGEPAAIRAEDIAVLGRTTASLRACQSVLEQLGHTVAVASNADEWLSSDLGRDAWLMATYRPESAISRRRIARELGVDASDRTLLAHSLHERPELLPFVEQSTPERFVELVGSTVSGDVYWPEDQAEIASVWSHFCDRSPKDSRSWPQFELFVARWQGGDAQQSGVRLLTVHKAQGREYKAVAVVGLNDGQFPDFRAQSDADKRSELRAFYVAVSRASRELLLTRPESITRRGGPWKRTPSPFLSLFPS